MAAAEDVAPLFAVVLTTHNRRDLLLRAIQSVLQQTWTDFELLVLDNGSTDGTQEAVQAIHDPRVVYCPNPRPTASCDVPRNLGLARARGRYIAFLDDDDFWYPEKLRRTREAFAQHPDVAAVCHYEHLWIGDRVAGVLRHGPWTEDFFERLLYDRNCLSSCATTLTTELLRQCGGFTIRPEMDGVADYDCWLRLAARGARIHFLEEPLGAFCQTGQNWSVVDTGTPSRLAFVVKHHLLAYERRPIYRVSRRGMWRLMEMYRLASEAFARSGQYWGAVRYGFHAAKFLLFRPSLLRNLWEVRVARRAVVPS